MRKFSRYAAVLGLAIASLFVGSIALQAENMTMLDPAGGQDMTMKMQDEAGALRQLLAASGWVNQSGSIMNFTALATGQITGTYINNAAGTGCQGSPYPLTGWINGNNIAWSVTWTNTTQNCNSVTAWGGYYTSSTGQITTNWVLAYQSASGGTTQLGQDVFTYQ